MVQVAAWGPWPGGVPGCLSPEGSDLTVVPDDLRSGGWLGKRPVRHKTKGAPSGAPFLGGWFQLSARSTRWVWNRASVSAHHAIRIITSWRSGGDITQPTRSWVGKLSTNENTSSDEPPASK